MEELGFNLVNVVNKEIANILEIDVFDIIEDLIVDKELLQKYLDITRKNELKSEGVSLWVSVGDEDQYMLQVEFEDFEEALYIPAKRTQLKINSPSEIGVD